MKILLSIEFEIQQAIWKIEKEEFYLMFILGCLNYDYTETGLIIAISDNVLLVSGLDNIRVVKIVFLIIMVFYKISGIINSFIYTFLNNVFGEIVFNKMRMRMYSNRQIPILLVQNTKFTSPFFHIFHLVNPSPWPFILASSLFLTMLSSVILLHYSGGNYKRDFICGLVSVFVCLAFWWRDIVRESTYEGIHTSVVRQGLLLGIALFIVSEVFLFFGFFWAFFHSSLTQPSSSIFGFYPCLTIPTIDPIKLPLVNTLTLILSGFTLTIAHRILKYIPYYDTYVRIIQVQLINWWLLITICLGSFFLFCQAFEYYYAKFCISDTIYGTNFYALTGLHGFHVIVGTVFLSICWLRSIQLHFFNYKQVGLISAVWYWHFVDVVWILLFFTVYIWGSQESSWWYSFLWL